MTIEQFTKEEFERTLTENGYKWNSLGWIGSELTFEIPLGNQVTVRIRSSIHHDGHAAEVGADSIRLWLQWNGVKTFNGGQSLIAKDVPIRQSYITREHGWQERLIKAIERLRLVRSVLGDCSCGYPRMALVAGVNAKPQNRGKVFTSCIQCRKWGAWLDVNQFNQQSSLPLNGVNDGTLQPTGHSNNTVEHSGTRVENASQQSRISNRKTGTETIGGLSLPRPNGEPSGQDKKQTRDGGLFGLSRDREKENHESAHGNGNRHSVSPVVVRVEPTPQAASASETSGDGQTPHGMNFLSDIPSLQLAENEHVAAPVKAFRPSRYQEAIFDFVRDDTSNAVVEAVAGSGKTTTLVKALEFTPHNQRVAFVAFNKHIATELTKRAPDHVHVSTLHSLGYSNIRRVLGKVTVDDKKLWNIFDKLTDDLPEMVRSQLQSDSSTMLRLVNLSKSTMREPTDDNLEWLCDRYGLEVNGNSEDIFDWVRRIHKASREDQTTIDYEDMIDWCAIGKVPCEKFDVLFGDEWQDMSESQIAMAVKSGERVVSVGDRWQSIYGFRGADTESIPRSIEVLHAKTLPLSICYRCAKSIVQLAKTIVPQIEWSDTAPDGTISHMAQPQMMQTIRPGDLVLCRTNAPLVQPCFSLIQRGIKATIRGRDIGKGLTELLDKCAKKSLAADLRSILFTLSQYVEKESAKLIAANKGTRAETLRDQQETLIALADGCYTVSAVKEKIGKVFSDDVSAITFSSVHRAKGDEANRVFILRPDLMPHPLAKQTWEVLQEQNLRYVAITRAKKELVWVEG